MAEATAYRVVTEHGLPHEGRKPALEAFGRALGGEIDCGQGLRPFAEALLAPYPAISEISDLVEAKIELLSDYKLDYPQDYSPSDIDRMNEEVDRLESLRCALAGHQL